MIPNVNINMALAIRVGATVLLVVVMQFRQAVAKDACSDQHNGCQPCDQASGCQVIAKLNVTDADVCCKQCSIRSGCKAWTVNNHNEGQCHLKTMSTTITSGNCVSGNVSPSPSPSGRPNIAKFTCGLSPHPLAPDSSTSSLSDERLCVGHTKQHGVWCAPEVLHEDVPTELSDVFAFAVIVFRGGVRLVWFRHAVLFRLYGLYHVAVHARVKTGILRLYVLKWQHYFGSSTFSW